MQSGNTDSKMLILHYTHAQCTANTQDKKVKALRSLINGPDDLSNSCVWHRWCAQAVAYVLRKMSGGRWVWDDQYWQTEVIHSLEWWGSWFCVRWQERGHCRAVVVTVKLHYVWWRHECQRRGCQALRLGTWRLSRWCSAQMKQGELEPFHLGQRVWYGWWIQPGMTKKIY